MTLKLNQLTREYVNQEVWMTLLLTDLKIKTARNGKKYADLKMQDQTKKCDVRLWDYGQHEDALASLDLPAIVDCRLLVGEYREQLQLTVKKCQPTDIQQMQIADFVQTSSWDEEKMREWLRDYYEFIKAPHIRQLVQEMVFSEAYYEKFCTYPAAKTVHHNFMHGIMQHTLEVLKYVKMVAVTKRLSLRQQDRLLAMAFLHDWAKIEEYEPVPSESLTLEGRMLGHIFIGAHKTQNVIRGIERFDRDDALIILNGILGHHGAYEWGSPVLPKTVEAQILHQADKLSGDVESVLSFMERQQDQQDGFTDKLWNMGTDYYKGGLE
ncbi:MAG: HD domain-containing protein [Bacillota bacterium]|nr:HD domain-containing protein [Bacillota bacterium]MDW7677577.1 HD domain-containing protein [Bacillota bacterium]